MRKHARTASILAMCTLTFVYRFNTMGGAYGGFDNDEFLSLAYAKQVESGAQPLRDFLDSGLQGARPSLTYELSAVAQRWLGDNLRSEAILTVGAIAIAAAFMFTAALCVAELPWAVGWTALAVLLTPKLYGYPKIVVLAVTSLLIVTAHRRRRSVRIPLMALWTAVAFLFRHDYASYAAVGFGLTLAALERNWRMRAVAPLACATLTLLLLTPSLLWIHKYAGLRSYFENGLVMSQREIRRTETVPPTLVRAPGESIFVAVVRPDNDALVLKDVFVGLPVAFIAVFVWAGLTRRARAEDATVLALAAMSVFVNTFFLRGGFEGRLGDAAPAVFVVAAAASSRLTERFRQQSRSWWAIRTTVAGLGFLLIAARVFSIGSVRHELIVAGIAGSPAQVIARAQLASRELLALPSTIWDGSNPSFRMQTAAYLHACTRPTDRILIMAYAPELFVFSDRQFAGGRATVLPGFYVDERYDRFTVGKLNLESVPYIVTERADPYDDDYTRDFPLLDERLKFGYREVGPFHDDYHDLRLFARVGPPSARTFGPARLPCQ